MKRLLKKLLFPFEILRIISHFEFSYIWWSLPQIFIVPILSVLSVYAPKLILEQLTAEHSYANIALTISIYCGVLFLLKNINVILSEKSRISADRFSKRLRVEVGKTTMQLNLSDIESPDKQDVILLAQNAEKLVGSFSIFQKVISNIITVITLSIIVVDLDIILLCAISIVLSLKIFFSVWQYLCNKKVREKFAKNERVGNYLQGLAYFDFGAQKEIRVNSLQTWFMTKINDYRSEMLYLQYRDFRRNAAFNIISALLTAVEVFLVFIILISKYIKELISIADFTMYFSATTTIATSLFSLASNFEALSEQSLNLDDYRKLFDLANQDTKKSDIVAKGKNIFEKPTIEFKDVSFAYPGTDKLVLKNINLTIHNNEKLVIVGLNGSGKTTLIKLLCKFYKPILGTICINGVDIWEIPNDEYYRQIGAVFQDFQNFSFSLGENIALCEIPDDEKILSLCNELNLSSFVSSTPNGLQTYISKIFSPSGIELSGGEGQKIAILRAIYKNAPILILDEPTANLDAKTENEIYSDFFKISDNKTTIFVSHRLAVSSIADNVVVFDNGKIIEYGQHKDLMLLDGVYAEMYKKQSSFYV